MRDVWHIWLFGGGVLLGMFGERFLLSEIRQCEWYRMDAAVALRLACLVVGVAITVWLLRGRKVGDLWRK